MKKSKNKLGDFIYYTSNRKDVEKSIYRSDHHIVLTIDSSQGEPAVYPKRNVDWTASEHEIAAWIDQAANTTIDFSAPDNSSLALSANFKFPVSFENLASELQRAILDYLEFKQRFEDAPMPSQRSARSFLFLVPALAPYEPDVSIDSTNGCVNLSIHTKKSAVLTFQIGSDEKIYFSLAGRGERVVKITGTAKFKTARDHLQFRRVLNLL